MIFEGDHSVIQALKEKKRLIETGQDHSHIRPMCIQGGGLMRGAYGVGAALALEEMGYTNSFSQLVGLSSGAPIVSHFAAGTTNQAFPLLLEDCCNRRFVNPWRFWNQVDSKHFIDILKNAEHKKIDVEKVFQNPAELYFGVAEYSTAKPKLLRPRDAEHLFDCIHASINMQNVSPHRVIIDGVHYADGGFSKPHVFSEAVKKLNPTHVLIITNNDRIFSPISSVEKILNRTLFRLRLNGILTQAINRRRETRDDAIAEVFASETKAAVVWGDGSIGAMEKNVPKIESTIESSRLWWHGLFSTEE